MKRPNASKSVGQIAVQVFSFALVMAFAVSGGNAPATAEPPMLLAQIKAPAEPKRAAPAATVKLSPALQAALKRGDTKTAMSLAKDSLKAPSGTTKYECKSGNCACAGVSDCMNMVVNDKKCKEGTVGCNDNGCTCQGN